MLITSARTDTGWLAKLRGAIYNEGFGVVTEVLSRALVERTRAAMYEAQKKIVRDVGKQRLEAAGEIGVLRLMALYDEFFLELLALPEMLAIVDDVVSETSILHLQNGFILPPRAASGCGSFQHTFHRDFPRHLHGYVASLNVMLTLDAFTAANGGTLVVPGTHQRPTAPDQNYLEAAAVAVECPAGSMIAFDSTVWHAAGQNRSQADRLAINHQFTRSFIKQQMDYVRALGESCVLKQPPRVQQLLGWYTRVVTSLDEYYQPPEKRLYRAGQG